MSAAEVTKDLDVSIESFFEAICDFSAYPNFVTGVHSVDIEKIEDGVNKVQFDLEMVKRIQYCIEAKQELSGDRGSLKWSLVESPFFNKNDGEWSLEKLSDTKTRVSYSLDVDFNFPVPGLIKRSLIKKSLPKAIDDFYREAKKRG